MKEISYAVTLIVVIVSLGAIFVIGGPTGLATASFEQSDTLGSCCCNGPQGIFKVTSGKLLIETTHDICAIACAKEGSFGTPINTIGAC